MRALATMPLALAVALLASSAAAGSDIPIAGKKLALRARRQGRSARVVMRDPAIGPPFPDPTSSASSFVLSGGAAAGQCHVEVALDPAKWRPLRRDGRQRGYRYVDRAPGTQGIRRIVIRPGRIVVSARGSGWPCGLEAESERVPVSATLSIGTTRYCAAFGGTVVRNSPGRFRARNAPPPSECPKTDLTVADLNILHGLFCPAETGSCRLADRIDLLFQWIAGSGCPDVVTLQEVWDPAVPLIEAHLATTCPFTYERAYVRSNGIDDAMILTRYPAVATELVKLYKNFRTVLFARLDHPVGPVDVFTTHLASEADGASRPCGSDCPAECVAAGASTVRECQAVQTANFVASRHDVATPAVLTGDFNATPSSFVHQHIVGRGWVDTYLAAGNPECDPTTGIGCTSGRQDESLVDMESPASNETERIDYVFLIPPGAGSLCTAALDPAADLDGDGSATRIFADDPNPFAPTCGPAPDPICWPSDHEGAELDLECG